MLCTPVGVDYPPVVLNIDRSTVVTHTVDIEKLTCHDA